MNVALAFVCTYLFLTMSAIVLWLGLKLMKLIGHIKIQSSCFHLRSCHIFPFAYRLGVVSSSAHDGRQWDSHKEGHNSHQEDHHSNQENHHSNQGGHHSHQEGHHPNQVLVDGLDCGSQALSLRCWQLPQSRPGIEKLRPPGSRFLMRDWGTLKEDHVFYCWGSGHHHLSFSRSLHSTSQLQWFPFQFLTI